MRSPSRRDSRRQGAAAGRAGPRPARRPGAEQRLVVEEGPRAGPAHARARASASARGPTKAGAPSESHRSARSPRRAGEPRSGGPSMPRPPPRAPRPPRASPGTGRWRRPAPPPQQREERGPRRAHPLLGVAGVPVDRELAGMAPRSRRTRSKEKSVAMTVPATPRPRVRRRRRGRRPGVPPRGDPLPRTPAEPLGAPQHARVVRVRAEEEEASCSRIRSAGLAQRDSARPRGAGAGPTRARTLVPDGLEARQEGRPDSRGTAGMLLRLCSARPEERCA